MPPVIYPREGSGEFIYAYSYPPGKTGGAQIVVANTAASARSNPFSANCSLISVTANANFFFEVGDNTVTANTLSHFGLANYVYDIALTAGNFSRPDSNSIAVITNVGNAAVYISERF